MPVLALAPYDSPADLVARLAVPHRARAAFWELMRLGPKAAEAVREGMNDANADVRAYCAQFLDHFLEPAALEGLIAMLSDPDPAVRSRALHTLACERCKEGACHPDQARVIPLAIRLLEEDPDYHVRNFAVGTVGEAVHTHPDALGALQSALANDPHPAIRKKARWYLPGGPIWRRTAPKPARRVKPA